MSARGDTLLALMRQAFGLVFEFGDVPSMDGSALTTIELFREREAEASGWRGALPNGLKFNDSPEVVYRKLKDPLVEKTEDDFVGYALWHFDAYSLQVKYSTMYNWILTVKIYGPGVWDSY
jgi:hypothetical protein